MGKEEELTKIELSKEQQWDRLIVLFTILASILSANVIFLGSKLLTDGILEPKFPNVIIKDLWKIENKPVGMPRLNLAIVSSEGFIDTFSTNSEKNVTIFPKLPERRYLYHGYGISYTILGVNFDSKIYFINCSPDADVTVYNTKDGSNFLVPDSKIPNIHFQYVHGILVGKYFWIFGGFDITDQMCKS